LPLDDLGNVINPFTDASSNAATGLNSFIQNSFDSLDTSLPQGYLVTMFFDNDLNLVPEYSGVQRVTEAGSLQKLAVMNQKMPTDGFYYTYVTNQSAQLVQTDNFTYIHIEGVLKEATDYYPYGLLCSSATITSVNTSNNYKFQDKEFNRKEFVNTWGLDWYNHGARMYDPELGRWHVQDPALQFANPYLAMGNNPVKFVDPDGKNIIGELFDAFEYLSPIVVRPEFNYGSNKFGLGMSISIGVPKASIVSYRAEYGKSYNFKNGEMPTGWETRKGGELSLGGLSQTVTKYSYQGSDITQTTNMIKIGYPLVNMKYENDFQPAILRKISPSFMPKQDDGDRYGTAAFKLQLGMLSVGFNIETGDPGLDPENRNKNVAAINGQDTYTSNNGSSPDSKRSGIAYIGFGSMKLGINSGGVRHAIQNRFAHDFVGRNLLGGKIPWFKRLPEEKGGEFFFEFGTGSNTLW
jgi:RHS repeat-associated protein